MNDFQALLKDRGAPGLRCWTEALQKLGFCELTSTTAFRNEEMSLIFLPECEQNPDGRMGAKFYK